jgi:hypothetical protein
MGEDEAKCRRRSVLHLGEEEGREKSVKVRDRRLAAHAVPEDPSQPFGASDLMAPAGDGGRGFRSRGSLPIRRRQDCALACPKRWRSIHGSRADRGGRRRREGLRFGRSITRRNRPRMHRRTRRGSRLRCGWGVLDQLCRREREFGGLFYSLRARDIRVQRAHDADDPPERRAPHDDAYGKARGYAAGTDHRRLSKVVFVVAHDAHVG